MSWWLSLSWMINLHRPDMWRRWGRALFGPMGLCEWGGTFHSIAAIQLPRLKQNKSHISNLLSSIDPTFSSVWLPLHVSLSRIVGFILMVMTSAEGGGKMNKHRRTLNRRMVPFDSLTVKTVRHVVRGEWTLMAQMDAGMKERKMSVDGLLLLAQSFLLGSVFFLFCFRFNVSPPTF